MKDSTPVYEGTIIEYQHTVKASINQQLITVSQSPLSNPTNLTRLIGVAQSSYSSEQFSAVIAQSSFQSSVKTKTKVIALGNHNRCKHNRQSMSQSELKANTCSTKHKKMPMSKSQLVLALLLIG